MSITISLIVLNLIAFVLFTILIALNENASQYIAIQPLNIFQGKYLWTFITSMFMHAGFFHIFVNMLSLFFVGSLVERILGAKRYLYFYLVAGIFAALLFVLAALVFPAEAEHFAVGASGAIFGLIGLLMVLTPNLPVFIMFIPIPIKMKYAAPGILIVLWLVSLAGNVPIGNTAHLGGFILGLGYGIYLRNKYKRKTQYISKYFS
jgi:membrane associated rhomboid family serine protease